MALIILLIMPGCLRKEAPLERQVFSLVEKNYLAADVLGHQLANHDLGKRPVLAASFVSLDDLDLSSPLGRVLPHQIASRLVSCYGLNFIDIRTGKSSLRMDMEQGELILSRDPELLSRDVQAYAVLTGTYSVVYNQVYVNARIIRSMDHSVLASFDYILPYNRLALDPGGSPDQAGPGGGSDFEPNVLAGF
ncbi:FlgO family outer membrane protein [Desulfonatronovibrio hydrogenovorans]|uniref:FlgO family outer membrane protein n=1 Tax=Desulfonatronovibrio hydrogenovorans TaxID=53245 RepID=UPI00123727E9|nr:FlgO family outer membrane protein [Desulfonatronovibrio hydrogenovorans]